MSYADLTLFTDGMQIDCDTAGTTAPELSLGSIKCYLIAGYVDWVKIKVTGFDTVSPGDVFHLKIPATANPKALLWDFAL